MRRVGSSIKTVTFKKEIPWPENGTYGLNSSWPMNIMWFLGLYRAATQVPNCSPINLIGSTKEFLKWANQYKHFRLKKVRLTWVPMVKGPISRVDPGKWATYAPQVGVDAMVNYVNITDPTANPNVDPKAFHSYQTDYEAYIVDPVVMPAYGKLDNAIGVDQFYLAERDFGDVAISNDQLPLIKRPHAKRYLMDHTWSHSWVPRVPKVFRFAYTTPNVNVDDGVNNLLSTTDGSLTRFPWLPIIVNQRVNNQPVDESVTLRTDCTVPYIAIRDRRNYNWQGAASTSIRTVLGIPGKWHFHVTFQFKTRRSSMSAILVDMDGNGTFTKSATARSGAPQPSTY